MYVCSCHCILHNYTPHLHRCKQNLKDYSCAIKLKKILHTTMWFKATFIGEPSNMWTRWLCSKSVDMELLYILKCSLDFIKVCDEKTMMKKNNEKTTCCCCCCFAVVAVLFCSLYERREKEGRIWTAVIR